MTQARGVLPHRHDKVMANPMAQGAIITATLAPGLARDAVQAWLGKVEQGIATLRAERTPEGDRVATVATGFSPSFFLAGGAPRFEGLQTPVGLTRLPAVLSAAPVAADAVFYLVSLSEGVTARFLHLLWGTRPELQTLQVERGYARLDGTEPFGYADGVRNVVPKTDRHRTVYVDADRHADEPALAVGGTYLTYLRITQHLDQFATLESTTQDAVIGRARDGRRLDLPTDTRLSAEPDSFGDTCPVASHVRKSGPRGTGNDTVEIFRRGLPFCQTTADGTLTAGLQFVSFQASLDQFDVIFNRWMMNPDFPTPGTGLDALFARGLLTVDKHAFFFCPAETDGSIATTLFAERSAPAKTKTGRVFVRKRLLDAGTGGSSLLDLHGFAFQLTTLDGAPVGGVFTTDGVGHALSDEVPIGDYLLTELPPRAPLTAIAPMPVTLKSAHEAVQVTNTVPPGTPTYR